MYQLKCFLFAFFKTQKWQQFLCDGCSKYLLLFFVGFVAVSFKTKMFSLTWSCCFDKSLAGDMLAKWVLVFAYISTLFGIRCLFVCVCVYSKQFEILSFGE